MFDGRLGAHLLRANLSQGLALLEEPIHAGGTLDDFLKQPACIWLELFKGAAQAARVPIQRDPSQTIPPGTRQYSSMTSDIDSQNKLSFKTRLGRRNQLMSATPFDDSLHRLVCSRVQLKLLQNLPGCTRAEHITCPSTCRYSLTEFWGMQGHACQVLSSQTQSLIMRTSRCLNDAAPG
jgi:hypothetical protein